MRVYLADTKDEKDIKHCLQTVYILLGGDRPHTHTHTHTHSEVCQMVISVMEKSLVGEVKNEACVGTGEGVVLVTFLNSLVRPHYEIMLKKD